MDFYCNVSYVNAVKHFGSALNALFGQYFLLKYNIDIIYAPKKKGSSHQKAQIEF